MAKRFKFFIYIALFATLALSGCKKPTTMILFNSKPITKETVLQNAIEFTKDRRIYYLFITEKELTTDIIRVELRKKDEKVEFWGVKVVFANDYRVSKDQLYYYNDYIVLHEAGHYYMLIYDKNNLDKPLAVSDFYVKDYL